MVEDSEAPTPNMRGQSSGSRSIAACVQPNCQPSQWLGGLLASLSHRQTREGGLGVANNHRPAHAHMQSVCGQAKAKDRRQENVANKKDSSKTQTNNKRRARGGSFGRKARVGKPDQSGGEPEGTKNTGTCGNRELTYLPSSLCGCTAGSDRLDLLGGGLKWGEEARRGNGSSLNSATAGHGEEEERSG